MANYEGMELPKQMHVKRRYNQVEITYNWFRLSNILITVLAAAVAFGGGYFGDIPFVIRSLIAVLLMYVAIAGWVNKTRILITDQHISVSYFPLPWVGAKTIDTEAVKKLYNQKKTFMSFGGHAVLIVSDGVEDLKLVGGFVDKKQAVYVQQEIERYLGIDNQGWLVREMLG